MKEVSAAVAHFKLTRPTQQRRNCELFCAACESWGACGPEEGVCRWHKGFYAGITTSQQIRLLGAKFDVHLLFRPLPCGWQALTGQRLLRPPAAEGGSLQLRHTGWWQRLNCLQHPAKTWPAWSCPGHSTASSANAQNCIQESCQEANNCLLVGDLI